MSKVGVVRKIVNDLLKASGGKPVLKKFKFMMSQGELKELAKFYDIEFTEEGYKFSAKEDNSLR